MFQIWFLFGIFCILILSVTISFEIVIYIAISFKDALLADFHKKLHISHINQITDFDILIIILRVFVFFKTLIWFNIDCSRNSLRSIPGQKFTPRQLRLLASGHLTHFCAKNKRNIVEKL